MKTERRPLWGDRRPVRVGRVSGGRRWKRSKENDAYIDNATRKLTTLCDSIFKIFFILCVFYFYVYLCITYVPGA